jgi:hypothetical protein
MLRSSKRTHATCSAHTVQLAFGFRETGDPLIDHGCDGDNEIHKDSKSHPKNTLKMTNSRKKYISNHEIFR